MTTYHARLQQISTTRSLQTSTQSRLIDWEARRGCRVTFALKKQKMSEKNGMGRCYQEHDIFGGSPLVLSLLRTALLQPSFRGGLLGLSDWGLDIWLGSYSAGRL